MRPRALAPAATRSGATWMTHARACACATCARKAQTRAVVFLPRGARAAAGATRVVARASGGAGEEGWEDLFAEFAKQAEFAEAEHSIPRAKTRVLERALARGRRQVQVRELCQELELDRSEILAWLKRNGHRAHELAKKHAEEMENEDAEREEEERIKAEKERAKAKRDAMKEEGARATGPGGMPKYKSYKKTRLGSANVSTLEKVYATTQYPDDHMIESIHQATRLPVSKIITWFKERRGEQKVTRDRQVRALRDDAPSYGGIDRREGSAARRGTTGAYSFTGRPQQRRDEGRDDRRAGMRSGDKRDEYGSSTGRRAGRDSSSEWTSN